MTRLQFALEQETKMLSILTDAATYKTKMLHTPIDAAT